MAFLNDTGLTRYDGKLKNLMAAAYSTSATYAVGDYCIHGGSLYKCTAAIESAESWTAAHWTKVNLGDEIDSAKEDIARLKLDIADVYDSTATYAVGDYCMKDGVLYRCTTAISTPEAWTSGHWTAVQVGDELGTLKGAINGKMPVNPETIEIHPPSGSSHGGYIDFHYSGSSADYTSRIIENSSGNIHVSGSMSIGAPLPVSSGGTGNTSVDTTPTQNSSKMVTSGGVFNSLGYDIIKAGTYNIGAMILPAYITGSGNYCDFFVPVRIPSEKTISSCLIDLSSTTAYTKDGVLNNAIDTSAVTVLRSSGTAGEWGFRAEAHFATTQSPNTNCTLLVAGFTIVIT